MARILLILMGLMLLPGIGSAAVDDDVVKLTAKAEKATGGKRAKYMAELAQRYVEISNDHYAAGDIDKAHVALQAVVKYAGQARDAARSSRKNMKDAEIRIRKAARRLDDIRRTLSFEEQGEVEKVVERLEEFRRELLTEMFGVKLKDES